MTMVTVRVTKPGNRLVYINGNYVEAAGNSSVDSLTVGRALLASDPEFAHLLNIIGGTVTASLPSIDEACKLL
jgi:hypothetical protein